MKQQIKLLLKNSYENPDVQISREQRYNLRTELLSLGAVAADNVIKIASMLKRRSADNYYIIYAILTEYNNATQTYDSQAILSRENKSDALEESCQIISNNIKNKEFIDQIYKDIRLGNNIEKIYYPNQLKKDLVQIRKFNEMLNVLNTSERF